MLEAKAKDTTRKCSPQTNKKRSSLKKIAHFPQNSGVLQTIKVFKIFSQGLWHAPSRNKIGHNLGPFSTSKKQCCPRARAGHFRELAGLKAKAKDFKLCPRGLHLWLLQYGSMFMLVEKTYQLLKLSTFSKTY